jgi:hypothetical protein
MVFGIIYFSLLDGGLTSTLLASRFFSPEGNDLRKKEREQAIVQRVIEDYRNLQASSDALDKIYPRSLPHVSTSTPHSSAGSSIIDEIGEMADSISPAQRLQARDASHGIFSIVGGGIFHHPKVALWHQISTGKLFTVLVCERDENRVLAQQFLEAFMAIKELGTLSIEKVLEVWHLFLPCGKLSMLPPRAL